MSNPQQDHPIITLTTDFGGRDPYVAAMKGVLRNLCPRAEIMDLTHDIAPGNRVEAALFLEGAMPYFPSWTLHVAVVDPGVGTERRAVAVLAGGQVFIGPDNGLITLFLRRHALDGAWSITNQTFMSDAVCPTFHGRDVFAVSAARVAMGASLAAAGPRITDLELLPVPEPCQDADGVLHGEILHFDRFGNAITSIERKHLDPDRAVCVEAGGMRIDTVSQTYGYADAGTPLALFGSADRLEIAVAQGNAQQRLALNLGMPVRVRPRGEGRELS